ncbi:hypothetical protein ACFQ2T_08785 [Methylophilus flavus]|uniref:DUF4239 domain-containing protein n=1 Tax=Methylophilus flavus TaxID=640084 RepID=A0ABW3PDX5_9PROT
MQPTLENVVKELPGYLSNFTHMMTNPSALVRDHVAADNPKARLEQSITFLFLSFAIAVVLAVVFPEVTNPVQLVGDEKGLAAHAFAAIRLLFELLGLATLAYLAVKITGVQSGFQRFFGLICAACGLILVIQIFAASLTNISMADPVTAKAWIAMEKGMEKLRPLIEQGVLCSTDAHTGEVNADHQLASLFKTQLAALQVTYERATDRPLYQLATGLQGLAMLVLLIWCGRVWFLYLKSHALSTGKMILATGLLVVFAGAGMLVYELVNTGVAMMSLYRQCE